MTDGKKKELDVELTETVVKYDFSQDELVDIGEKVAEWAGKLAALEAEAKQIAKQYKADIEGIEVNQNKLLTFIRDKYEYKTMECFKVIDTLAKKVFFYRTDQVDLQILKQHTIEELRAGLLHPGPAKVRDIRLGEMQRSLPLKSKSGNEANKEIAEEMTEKATE